MPPNNKLAIIAGNGTLTTILAKSASDLGFNTTAVAITDEASRNLEGICNKVYKFSPGQLLKYLTS